MIEEDYIQRYLSNQLTEAENRQFEQRLASDEKFKKAYDWYFDLHKAFAHNEASRLKSELQQLTITSDKNHHASRQQKYIYIGIAVALIAGFLFNILTVQTGKQLYNNFFELYPNTYEPVVRGSNNEFRAFEAYEMKDFILSERLFLEKLETTDNPNIRFYLALSKLNQGKSDEALSELEALKHREFDYLPETLWYIALIYLKQDDRENAKDYLIQLDNGASEFKSKERKLLLQKL